MQSYPIDIHTHRLVPVPGESIVSCLPDAFFPQEDGWYSVGIHPWNLDSYDWMDATFRTYFESLVCHPQVLAVGEVGLDKLVSVPLDSQIEALRYQADLAESIGKPLVLHLVKATTELLALKRELNPRVPWIVHGFRGKAQLALDLVRHGLYLSFGACYQEEALRQMPADRLFLETDESDVPISDLYERAALVRGVTCDELVETVSRNVQSVFFGH